MLAVHSIRRRNGTQHEIFPVKCSDGVNSNWWRHSGLHSRPISSSALKLAHSASALTLSPPSLFFQNLFFILLFPYLPLFFISIRFFLSNVLPISSYLFFLPYCFSRCRCSLSILSSTFDNPLFICASFPSLFHVSVTVHINTRA